MHSKRADLLYLKNKVWFGAWIASHWPNSIDNVSDTV